MLYDIVLVSVVRERESAISRHISPSSKSCWLFFLLSFRFYFLTKICKVKSCSLSATLAASGTFWYVIFGYCLVLNVFILLWFLSSYLFFFLAVRDLPCCAGFALAAASRGHVWRRRRASHCGGLSYGEHTLCKCRCFLYGNSHPGRRWYLQQD